MCTKTFLSRYYTLFFFLHKTIQLLPFDLQSTARCPPFYKLVTSVAFSMNYSIHSHVCNIDTMMLNFNGMIKWYDISCATLYEQNLWQLICRNQLHDVPVALLVTTAREHGSRMVFYLTVVASVQSRLCLCVMFTCQTKI